MTGKRQIPINNHEPADGAKATPGPGAAPGGAGAQHGSRGAAPKAPPAGNSKDAAAPQNLQAERGSLGTDPERLAAERDALVVERDSLATERDSLLAERDGASDSLLRLRAEFENFRKRASRELIEAGVRAQGELLHDLLPVLDNLERALDAAEHHEEGKVLDGVRMTRDMFVDLLARSGVEEISGVGTQFDPHVHEAIQVQPSEHDEGLVAAVIQRGYRQGERVLRPARVAVSAGQGPGGGTPGGAG